MAAKIFIESSIGQELLAVRSKIPLVPGPDGTGLDSVRSSPAEQFQKKNFAQRLSDELALKIANGLRPAFPGILPVAGSASTGSESKAIVGLESLARSLKGVKRLDVNFSTLQLGLGLGVSIKTLNFRDPKSKRYTKNVTRIDNELRAEASDYHERQPHAVLVGLVFLPADSVNETPISSFGHAAQSYRFRTGRSSHTDSPALFERLYIALYEASDTATLGSVICFDVANSPPKTGLPKTEHRLTLQLVLEQCVVAFYDRNTPRQLWADSEATEDKAKALEDIADLAATEDDSDEDEA
jgi:hypothetical protein